jgi:hypothetical protein
MRYAFFLLAALISASCGSIVIDPSANAAESNDTSVIIEGCGNQPISGYTYCRRPEGQMTDRDVLTFHVPVSNCDEDSCVTLTFFGTAGEIVRRYDVQKEHSRFSVHWSRLTGRNEFTRLHRGLWIVVMDVYWKHEGVNRRTSLEGEIRLRVLSQGYQSLSTAVNPGVLAFRWSVPGFDMGYSTAGRSSVWNSR